MKQPKNNRTERSHVRNREKNDTTQAKKQISHAGEKIWEKEEE